YAHPYIAAVTTDDARVVGDLRPGFEVDDELSDDAIYIIEDSLVDLGLLVTVHRNWRRLLEIVTDYLVWYQTPEQPAVVAPEPDAVPVFPDDSPEEIAERARIAAEQETEGSTQARPPRKPSWWLG